MHRYLATVVVRNCAGRRWLRRMQEREGLAGEPRARLMQRWPVRQEICGLHTIIWLRQVVAITTGIWPQA